MSKLDDIRSKRSELEALGNRYGVSNIRVFGSVLYQDEAPQDVDLLVDVPEDFYAGNLGEFNDEASALLNIRVDSVRADRLYPPFAKHILSQMQPLMEIHAMPGKKPPKNHMIYVDHMLGYIAAINRYIDEAGEGYFETGVYKDAILFNLQQIIEQSKKLPEEWKTSEPDIEWRAMKGFRDILVHDYEGRFNPEVARQVIERHLQPLKTVLKRMKERYRDE